jgi:hypothetical protein
MQIASRMNNNDIGQESGGPYIVETVSIQEMPHHTPLLHLGSGVVDAGTSHQCHLHSPQGEKFLLLVLTAVSFLQRQP